jgi:antitoxin (DNA-binding transcriptional repressor) of toxin-antitoxin stability system
MLKWPWRRRARCLFDNVASCGYIYSMKTVGIRELKNHLSEYLRRVRLGESVLVTDRGEVVAEFSPPTRGATDTSLPVGLLALAKRGLVTLGAPRDGGEYEPLPRPRRGRRTAAQLLDEERGSR